MRQTLTYIEFNPFETQRGLYIIGNVTAMVNNYTTLITHRINTCTDISEDKLKAHSRLSGHMKVKTVDIQFIIQTGCSHCMIYAEQEY